VAQEIYGETFRQKSACASPDLSARNFVIRPTIEVLRGGHEEFPRRTDSSSVPIPKGRFAWLHAGSVIVSSNDQRRMITGIPSLIREGLVDMLLLSAAVPL